MHVVLVGGNDRVLQDVRDALPVGRRQLALPAQAVCVRLDAATQLTYRQFLLPESIAQACVAEPTLAVCGAREHVTCLVAGLVQRLQGRCHEIGAQ